MAFGLKLRKIQAPVKGQLRKYTKKEIDEKVKAAAKILAIEEYLKLKKDPPTQI